MIVIIGLTPSAVGSSDPSAARLMTHSTDRPIPFFLFSPKSDSVLYMQDKAGDENFLFYQVDIASGEERALTPFEKTRVRFVGGCDRPGLPAHSRRLRRCLRRGRR